MRLIDADKLKTTAVLGVQLQHADSQYYYFYEEETIDKAPTVKAIPIEWIEKYIKQNYCTCDLVYPEEFLKELVTWWGEENESNISN